MSLNRELEAYVHAHDVDFVGVTTVAPFLRANGDRVDPKAIMPEARSLVVTGFYTFTNESRKPSEPGIPRGRFGPWTRLSMPAIQHQARVVTAFFSERGLMARAAPKIPAKAAAVRAGWARYGKNSIVHVRGFGSYVKINAFLTNADLETVEIPIESSDCGDCTACMDACPTGALKTPYHLDRTKCVCAWLWGKPIAAGMRKCVGNHLHRCSFCQDACPLNRSLTPRERVPFDLDGPSASPELIPLMLGDDDLLRRSLPGFVMQAGVDTIRRNVAIALGNTGDPASVPPLVAGLQSPAGQVRSHSAWALGVIGGRESTQALSQALSREQDPEVRGEIWAALFARDERGRTPPFLTQERPS